MQWYDVPPVPNQSYPALKDTFAFWRGTHCAVESELLTRCQSPSQLLVARMVLIHELEACELAMRWCCLSVTALPLLHRLDKMGILICPRNVLTVG
jgi:hypothetical protein